MDITKPQKRVISLKIMLMPSERDRWLAEAQRNQMNLSEWVRQAVRAALKAADA